MCINRLIQSNIFIFGKLFSVLFLHNFQVEILSSLFAFFAHIDIYFLLITETNHASFVSVSLNKGIFHLFLRFRYLVQRVVGSIHQLIDFLVHLLSAISSLSVFDVELQLIGVSLIVVSVICNLFCRSILEAFLNVLAMLYFFSFHQFTSDLVLLKHFDLFYFILN